MSLPSRSITTRRHSLAWAMAVVAVVAANLAALRAILPEFLTPDL